MRPRIPRQDDGDGPRIGRRAARETETTGKMMAIWLLGVAVIVVVVVLLV